MVDIHDAAIGEEGGGVEALKGQLKAVKSLSNYDPTKGEVTADKEVRKNGGNKD